jgi:membrane protease YdiL (CAAX protease family)
MIPLILLFYGLLTAAALLLNHWRGAENPFSPVASLSVLSLHIAVGLLVSAIIIGACIWGSRKVTWLRRLERTFKDFLGDLSGGTIFLMALCSGIGEEAFFRGFLLPALSDALDSNAVGLLLSSLVFGALHFWPRKELLPWTAFATAMGLLLGGLYLLAGSIYPCMVLHFAVNLVNLHRINRLPPVPPNDGVCGGSSQKGMAHRAG